MEKIQYQDKVIEYEIQRGKMKNVYIQIKDGKVIIKAPSRVEQKEIKDIVNKKIKWIAKNLEKSESKQEKKELYTQEEFIQIVSKNVSELIKLTGLHPTRVRVKELRYAWGSCSIKKHITLNSNLIKYSQQAIRYVVLHECCHIKYMNHSKEFWNLVEKYMPEYKEVKKEFK